MARSMFKGAMLVLVGVAALSIVAGDAIAIPYYGFPAPFTGSRSVVDPNVGHGLQTDEPDWQDATLEWEVIPDPNGFYLYTYTLTGFDRPAISHITFDVTDDAINFFCDDDDDDDDDNGYDEDDDCNWLADPFVMYDVEVNGDPVDPNYLELGDKEGIVGSIKIDVGDEDEGDYVTYSFKSNRAPVYGDFRIKGGQTYMVNTGFGDQSIEDALAYIARPNGLGNPAEPATLSLIGLGAAAILRRRRR